MQGPIMPEDIVEGYSTLPVSNILIDLSNISYLLILIIYQVSSLKRVGKMEKVYSSERKRS